MSKPYRDNDNASLWRQYADELEVENSVLKAQNAKLKESVVPWPERVWCSIWSEDTMLNFIGLLIAVGLSGILFFAGYALFKASTATNQAEHCFFEPQDGGIRLKGYVSWASNKDFGRFKDANEAAAFAERISCRIK